MCIVPSYTQSIDTAVLKIKGHYNTINSTIITIKDTLRQV